MLGSAPPYPLGHPGATLYWVILLLVDRCDQKMYDMKKLTLFVLEVMAYFWQKLLQIGIVMNISFAAVTNS